MSRLESHEYDYPPGLATQRPQSRERDQPHAFVPSGLGTFVPPDRRQGSSNGLSSYAGFGALSRSGEAQDQSVYGYALPQIAGANRHNSSASLTQLTNSPPFSPYPHHTRRSSPPSSNSQTAVAYPTANSEHDALYYRQPQSNSQPSAPAAAPNSLAARSTLWWGELELWMDEEYAKQVCNLMAWDPVSIKVPHPAPDPSTGQQANNPGYCFLTFPTPALAAAVLAQVNNAGQSGRGTPPTMPNSSKPFVMNWASNVNTASPLSSGFPATAGQQPSQAVLSHQKEYSIFVGDLAPETSNSDLVAVFRNPVLGLRTDREPKYIRPFLSCKSAKIMLDPSTGVSRGYGFVRFTDEADQQRALIEMHGLYCLSRPMRISPATAKFKAPTVGMPYDAPPMTFTPPIAPSGTNNATQTVTLALPLPDSTQAKSVSAPIAATGSSASINGSAVSNSTSGSSIGGSHSSNSLSSGTSSSASISTSALPEELSSGIPAAVLAQLAQQYSNGDVTKLAHLNPLYDEEVRRLQATQGDGRSQGYQPNEESWKHHAQARAILSNLIGPNGEQLTSTDPYNTTVFVGGLSPLISEETLRTFFAPFGDIHYVKVPVGKHCGFVQFVRKADAERAIEKMQGFPIGGSRIRLSWGRSQYKAAQAAAQAAQAAAMQGPTYSSPAPTTAMGPLSQEQALQLLQRIGMSYPNGTSGYNNEIETALLTNGYGSLPEQKSSRPEESSYPPRPDILRTQSNFSPFSPDPNNRYNASTDTIRRDPTPYSRLDALPHPSKAYAPGFFPYPQDMKVNTAVGVGENRVSPTSSGRPSSANRYSFAESSDPPAPINRAPGRQEAPISRPGSGQLISGADSHDQLLHDLNGTLASLDLDRPWRSPEARAV